MWKKYSASLLVGALLVIGVSSASPASAADRSAEPTAGIIVELQDNKTVVSGVRRLSSSRFGVAEVPVDEATPRIESLRRRPGVKRVRLEQEYQSAVIPNDPSFPEQYGLQNSVNGLADIKAPAAWNITTGSSNTVIAIIDGGVDLRHEDLAGKIWTNSDEVAGNNTDDDGNGFIDDVHGWDFVSRKPALAAANHATHVAGIAAAAGNNGVGVAGVDWGARIMSVRVLSSFGAGRESAIAEGIHYAVVNGAKVINLSLVGAPSDLLAAAIQEAYNAGVVVVAAAGNSGASTTGGRVYPVCADVGGVDMVLGVGATDPAGEPAGFSNYGSCLNVSAPGKKIVSTVVGNDYDDMTGTSMSSPFVAGVAGLYLALHPGAGPAEVIAAITNNADPFTGADAADWNEDYKGKLNAARVVGVSGEALPLPPPSADTSPSQGAENNAGGSSDSGGSSGGGGGDSGGGGGGGGGSEESAQPAAKSRVAGATISAKANLALLPRIKDTFRFVFGRVLTVKEKTWWADRVKLGQKRTYLDLLGAMQWQKSKGRTMGK